MLQNMKAFKCSYIPKESKIRVTDMVEEVSVDIVINNKNEGLSLARIVESFMVDLAIKITHFADISKNGEASNDFLVLTEHLSAIIDTKKQNFPEAEIETEKEIKFCTCKEEIEAKLYKEISEKEPSRKLLSVSMHGYSIIFEKDEEGITCGKLRPTNSAELIFQHPKDKFKTKKEKTNIIGSYCTFCGKKLTK